VQADPDPAMLKNPCSFTRLVDDYHHSVASPEKMGMQSEAICHQQRQSTASNKVILVWSLQYI
jgi:hypothetical protein